MLLLHVPDGMEWIMVCSVCRRRCRCHDWVAVHAKTYHDVNGHEIKQFFHSMCAALFLPSLRCFVDHQHSDEESQHESGEVDAICSLCNTHAPHFCKCTFIQCRCMCEYMCVLVLEWMLVRHTHIFGMCEHIRAAKRGEKFWFFCHSFCHTTLFSLNISLSLCFSLSFILGCFSFLPTSTDSIFSSCVCVWTKFETNSGDFTIYCMDTWIRVYR